MGDGKSDIIDGYPPGFFYLRTAVRDLCPQLQSLFDLETFRSDEAVGLRNGPAPVGYANRTLWWVNPDTLQFFWRNELGRGKKEDNDAEELLDCETLLTTVTATGTTTSSSSSNTRTRPRRLGICPFCPAKGSHCETLLKASIHPLRSQVPPVVVEVWDRIKAVLPPSLLNGYEIVSFQLIYYQSYAPFVPFHTDDRCLPQDGVISIFIHGSDVCGKRILALKESAAGIINRLPADQVSITDKIHWKIEQHSVFGLIGRDIFGLNATHMHATMTAPEFPEQKMLVGLIRVICTTRTH
jgi:hypothetical protein